MNVLELFCGTKSIGKCCNELGWESVSVDIESKFNPEIINYFENIYYFIENPQTSLLKNQSFMKDFKYIDGDYCMYGTPYRKRTRIWTNREYESYPLKLCDKNCGSFIDGKHIGSCGTGGQGKGHKKSYSNKTYSKLEKYAIPSEFIYSLFLD